MKLQIKVKELTEGCMPEIRKDGEWIDLRCAETIILDAPQAGTLKRNTNKRDVEAEVSFIPLGVAMKLPEGFEAIVAPRSSSAAKFGFIQANSIGIIDNDFSSNLDQWKLPIIPIKEIKISKGSRICQFRIQPTQKATFKQKLKWLLSNGIKLVKVDDLGNDSRGGFGSTGTY